MESGHRTGGDVAERVSGLVVDLANSASAWADLPDAAVQDLMALAVRVYATRAVGREDPTAPVLPAYRPDSGVNATQVAIVAEQLLAAADVDIFELQMWRMLSSY